MYSQPNEAELTIAHTNRGQVSIYHKFLTQKKILFHNIYFSVAQSVERWSRDPGSWV